MTDQIQISIDREVYDQLLMLMVPPIRLSRNCWLKMDVPAPPLLLWVPPNNTTLWSRNSNAPDRASTIPEGIPEAHAVFASR